MSSDTWSEVLRAVRLQGAVFFLVDAAELTASWVELAGAFHRLRELEPQRCLRSPACRIVCAPIMVYRSPLIRSPGSQPSESGRVFVTTS